MQTLQDSNFLLTAMTSVLSKSPDGYAIMRKSRGHWINTWSNAALHKALGTDAQSFSGREAVNLLGVLPEAIRADVIDALSNNRDWAGVCKGIGGGEMHARIERLSAEAYCLWIKEQRRGGMEQRVADAFKNVDDISAANDGTLNGPKSFWRSVGAMWAVCGRNQLPVCLGLVNVSPPAEAEAEAFEELSRESMFRCFRRASDVVGRLGLNQYAIFIVGQPPQDLTERLELLGSMLPGSALLYGISHGEPSPGSTTQLIKSGSKKMLDQALASGSSQVGRFSGS